MTADQIRQQMDYVRHELNDDIEQAVENAGSLGDLRAYGKAQPIGWLIAAAVAGFVIVPARDHASSSTHLSQAANFGSVEFEPRKNRSILGAAFGLAATMATRIAMNKLATAGLGSFEHSQQDQRQNQVQTESYNREPYNG